MNSKAFRILIIVNLLIVAILYADLFLPINKSQSENFSSISIETRNFAGFRKSGGYEKYYNLDCKSGTRYKLYTAADLGNLKDNEKIDVNNTLIFSRVKSITNKNLKIENVSFIENGMVILLICLAIMIMLLNLFYSNTLLDILFGFSSVFIYYVTIAYLFYLN